MQKVLKTTIYIFLAIFSATAIVTLFGLGYLWFSHGQATSLPYLGWLLSILIAEVIGVVVVIGKRGILYMPEVLKNASPAETDLFMNQFISHGSTVTIVSNRLAWLIEARQVQTTMAKRAQSGTQFEIITSQPVVAAVREPLEAAGVRFFVLGLSTHRKPDSR